MHIKGNAAASAAAAAAAVRHQQPSQLQHSPALPLYCRAA